MLLPVRLLQILALVATISLTKALFPLKWCVVEEDMDKCQGFRKDYSHVECVSAPNIYRCMQLVMAGKAEFLLVSDTQLYVAGKMGLKPSAQLVDENTGEDYRYKAVAVIKAGGKIKSLADLKNAKSCHTGAGKTTGWTVPISNLIKMGILPIKSCYSTTENVGDFFAESCVPGAFTPRYNPFKLNPLRLCALCSGNSCTVDNKYAGYNGSMACLKETDADIAFVKHQTFVNADKTKYKLLCPSGKIMTLDKFNDCNWAFRPTDTVVSYPKALSEGDKVDELYVQFKNFKKNFDLKDAERLKSTSSNYTTILGAGFLATFEHYHNCKQDLRWCVISDGELKKCTDLKYAFMAKRATNYLGCVKANDHYDCMAKIEKNEADFVVLDGGDVHTAINNCKLEPVIAEDYGFGTASYYTVAVVKANANFNIKQLKGKKSCHTGIGKTSGWKSPISYLIQNNMLSTGHGHSIPEEVGEFFSASCVPGALDAKYNPHGDNPKSLCALCPNDGKDCQRNATNKYYDYSGAFRCLVEAGADVAFVKHTTVSESTDGKGEEDWERDLKSVDYKLLCKDGTLAAVSDWRKCHFAKVPAHAIVVRKDDKDNIGKLLFRVFSNFDLSDKESLKLLFSSPGGHNYLFKDSTKNLILIENPQNFLGKEYLEMVKVFGTKLDVCSGPTSSSTAVMPSTLLVFVLVNYFAHF